MKYFLIALFAIIASNSFAQKDTLNICSKIEERFDEFDNIKSFNTEMMFETKQSYGIDITNYGAFYTKNIKKGKVTYYLRLETSTVLPDITRTGVTILLKNGVKLRKPNAKVETDVDNKGEYCVSTFITLSPTDIVVLKKSPITKFKLYVDQGVVERSDDVYKMFLCILSRQ